MCGGAEARRRRGEARPAVLEALAGRAHQLGSTAAPALRRLAAVEGEAAMEGGGSKGAWASPAPPPRLLRFESGGSTGMPQKRAVLHMAAIFQSGKDKVKQLPTSAGLHVPQTL